MRIAPSAEWDNWTVDSPLSIVIEAAAFAADRHRDQRRKDVVASPYINRPLTLARILAVEAGVTDPVVLAAALLHDTIEDTQTDAAELRERFGDDVASVVLEVTGDKALERSARKQLQIERAVHVSSRAKLVKLADETANVRDVLRSPPSIWNVIRRKQYAQWTKDGIDALRGEHPVMEAIFDEAHAELFDVLAAMPYTLQPSGKPGW